MCFVVVPRMFYVLYLCLFVCFFSMFFKPHILCSLYICTETWILCSFPMIICLFLLVHQNFQNHNRKFLLYVCSRSIRIGIVVVVYWVGCVCSQSWHVHTCLGNLWHKLQVAAFAQLAVVGRGSNTCVYVIAILTMCKSTEQCICIKFCFKIGKTATETYQLLQQARSNGSYTSV